LVNPENTLNIKQSLQGHLVIDDSYNANLDGFLAAIKYVLTFKKRSPKILVTRGLYELGPLEKEAHTQIAAEALNAFDTIILLRPAVYKYFKDEAVRTKSKTKLFCFENPTEIIKLLQKYKQDKALILLENRVYAPVEKYLFDQES
jgi:UDP-N-acetylmuramoyl-tripeptide--D-alanyl-D-alanine ligase